MRYCFFSLLILLAGPVMSDQAVNQLASVDPVSSSYIGRIMVGLGLILALIFVLAWVMKKMQLTPHSGQQLIRVVSAISVGHRDRIALIEVGDEQILVGLTPGRIQKLHELKSSIQTSENDQVTGTQFAEKFSQLMHRGKNKPGQNHDL